MSRPTVPIKIDLPIELAEGLVEHGDLLLRAIEKAILETRRSIKSERFEEKRAERKRKREARDAEFLIDGRKAHRLLRQRLKSLPQSLKNKHRQDARKDAIVKIADALGLLPLYVDIAIRRHRDRLLPKVRKRRKFSVLRYLVQGLSNSEIASRSGFPLAMVIRDVAELRDDARGLGLSVFELERKRTEEKARFLSTQKQNDDDNLIKWADIKAAQGRP